MNVRIQRLFFSFKKSVKILTLQGFDTFFFLKRYRYQKYFDPIIMKSYNDQ